MTGWYGDKTPALLITRSKDGSKHRFYYHIHDNGFRTPYDFSVSVSTSGEWPPPPDEQLRHGMTLKRNEAGELQTIAMDNHNLPAYRGRGISEALLPELSKLLREDIVSSPTYEDNANRRSTSATVVWERLVARELAVREGDRFRLLYDRVRRLDV